MRQNILALSLRDRVLVQYRQMGEGVDAPWLCYVKIILLDTYALVWFL